MAATDNANQNLVVTAFWEVNPGEEGAVASLLKEFLPQAQREPGREGVPDSPEFGRATQVLLLRGVCRRGGIRRHQQTPHFKDIIVGQAVPKLAKRERAQFRFI